MNRKMTNDEKRLLAYYRSLPANIQKAALGLVAALVVSTSKRAPAVDADT